MSGKRRFLTNFIFQENHSRRTVFEKLHQFAFPLSVGETLFAFHYSEKFPQSDGWTIYEPIAELTRMLVSFPGFFFLRI